MSRSSYMLVFAVSFLVLVFYIPRAHSDAVEFTLVDNGLPACTIVIAENPTPSARLAALELQFHVLKMTGALLSVITDKEKVAGTKILVGDSDAALALGFKGSDFAPQEYLVALRPDTLILIGLDWEDTPENRQEFGRPMNCGDTLTATRHKIDFWKTVGHPERSTGEMELPGVYDDQGTCYATYHFIEQFCDVRWYGASQTSIIIPEQKTLRVKGKDIRRSPALKYRDALWSGNWPFMKGQWGPVTGSEIQLFWRRLRLGGEKWAGNHTFHRKTVETMFTDPEYQAQGPGKGSQLCYSNPKLIEKVAQMARDFFDGKTNAPEGWKAVGDYFALIPDDNSNYCRCDNCKEHLASGRKMETRQFSSGTVSNYFFTFVNAVAREVAKTHPDKYIATLAYWNYALPPQGFDLEPNVSIAPCLHTCMYAIHKEIRDNDMALYHDWLQKTKAPIFLWNYYHHPMEPALIDKFKCFPNVMVHETARTMRIFIEDGIRGIFICGEQDMLEGYVIAKIWDDPTQDTDMLINEFFDRYFGAAAKPMKAFYLKIEEIATNPENYKRPYYRRNGIDWKNVAWTMLGTEERMKQLGELMTQAQSMAQTDMEKQRVGLWHDALWKWMEEGRAQYLTEEKQG
jgi:GNAT superfamily N-acetyltransferase